VSVKTVNEHLVNIYGDAGIPPETTIRKFRIVQRESPRNVEHYSLDSILAAGYRVRSAHGTAFRQWATTRLSELLVKGFTMDDQRLKEGRTLGTDYFDELLARIRDIRSSERMFYQKITDIYATSIDYDSTAEATTLFFQTAQNKMHWAAHGHTAAEVIASRASAAKPHMGLTNWKNAPAGPVRTQGPEPDCLGLPRLRRAPGHQPSADAHARLDHQPSKATRSGAGCPSHRIDTCG
jgi:hypothetical protein